MFAEFDLAELGSIPFGLPLMWVLGVVVEVVLPATVWTSRAISLLFHTSFCPTGGCSTPLFVPQVGVPRLFLSHRWVYIMIANVVLVNMLIAMSVTVRYCPLLSVTTGGCTS